jgi:hypothetical protein
MIIDGHGGDDFLRIQEDRQRALDRHGGFDSATGLVDAGHPFRQAWIVRIGADEIIVVGRVHSPNLGQRTQ